MQQKCLNIEVLKNGNLSISATADGIEYLQDRVDTNNPNNTELGSDEIFWKQSTDNIWDELLEYTSCNGSYTRILPEDIGALTAAPIISSLPYDSEDDHTLVIDKDALIFWYPNYMVTDELSVLLRGETVIFDAVQQIVDIDKKPKMQQVLNELIQIEDIKTLRRMYNEKDFSTYSEAEMLAEWERREEVRQEEEKKKPTTAQKLQFILKNDPEHEQYEIDKIYKSCFDKALTKELPFTHFSDGTNYYFPKSYKVNHDNSLAVEKKRFLDYLKNVLHITADEMKLFGFTSSLFGFYWFRRNSNESVDQFVMSEDGYTELANFVMFLVTGNMPDTYKEVNEFLDSLTPKIGYSNKSAYAYTIGNISVKRFANGRIDIKGLTADQVKTIDKCFALHEKLRNK